MNRGQFVTSYRVFFALLVVTAVATQFVYGARQATFSPVNFFSFFTIESNVLAASTFFVALSWERRRPRGTLDWWRGAVTLYMTITGIVYALLLSGADVQLTLPWVNAVLHYIMPLAVLGDWLIDRPREQLTFRAALWWIALPVAYVAYSLLRGLLVHWYPYPFLDPRQHGYGRVALTSVIIMAATFGLIWLLAWTTQRPRPNVKPSSLRK